MSEKVALSVVVAENVRGWRTTRGLDQQALADRLDSLGWHVDRTTINRIENGKRKVTVDDLGVLAAALNVPLPLLLLPVHEATFADVALTPKGTTTAMHPWLLWEWMRGEEPLPGRIADGEWRSSAGLFWEYEALRAAQRECQASWPRREHDPDRYIDALQHLVDAVAAMERSAMPASGLVHEDFAADIGRLGVTARSPGARYQTVAEVESREAHHGQH